MSFSCLPSVHCIRQHPTAILEASTNNPQGLPNSKVGNLVALGPTQTLLQQIKSMLMLRGPRNLTGDLFSRQISKRFSYFRKPINASPQIRKKSRVCLTSFFEFGGFMSCTHATLCGSGPCRPEPIVCPTNVTDDWANLLFSNFRVRPALRIVSKNARTCCKCNDQLSCLSSSVQT